MQKVFIAFAFSTVFICLVLGSISASVTRKDRLKRSTAKKYKSNSSSAAAAAPPTKQSRNSTDKNSADSKTEKQPKQVRSALSVVCNEICVPAPND
jgi:hypothetical protein